MWPRATWPEELRAEASSSLGLPINYLQDDTVHISKLLFRCHCHWGGSCESSLRTRCFSEQRLAPTQEVWGPLGTPSPKVTSRLSQTLRTHGCAVLETDTNQKPTVDQDNGTQWQLHPEALSAPCEEHSAQSREVGAAASRDWDMMPEHKSYLTSLPPVNLYSAMNHEA